MPALFLIEVKQALVTDVLLDCAVAAAATVPKKAAAPAPAAAQPTVAGKKAAAPAPSAGSAFEDLGGGL